MQDAKLTAAGVEHVKCCGGGDVHRAHHKPRDGNHVQGELQLSGRVASTGLRHVAARALQVRPHADHVHIEFLKKPDVPGEILQPLAGNADHDPRSHLVAAPPERAQALKPPRKTLVVRALCTVQAVKEQRIGRFKAAQVAQRPRIAACRGPALVGAFALISQRERDAEAIGERLAHALRVNRLEHAFNEADEFLIAPLASLQAHRSVAVPGGPERGLKDLLGAHFVAPQLPVVPADAAIPAVGRADVGDFDESPVVHEAAQRAGGFFVGCKPQAGAVFGRAQGEQSRDFRVGQIGFLEQKGERFGIHFNFYDQSI